MENISTVSSQPVFRVEPFFSNVTSTTQTHPCDTTETVADLPPLLYQEDLEDACPALELPPDDPTEYVSTRFGFPKRNSP